MQNPNISMELPITPATIPTLRDEIVGPSQG
jgi:hypothetical protein